jgi:adenylate cyclase
MEIERKFLVNSFDFAGLIPKRIIQVYLEIDPEIRVRSIDDKEFYMTIKSNGFLVRSEKEVPISKSQFERYSKYSTLRIEKDRFYVGKYEIDYYDNALCVVEVEFKNIFQAIFFRKPEWFGRELTFNKNYKNIELAKEWSK